MSSPGIRAQLAAIGPLARALTLLAIAATVFLGTNIYFINGWQAESAQGFLHRLRINAVESLCPIQQ